MTIAVDLCSVLLPPLKERLFFLAILSNHGIEIVCQSFLDRDTTRKALRYLGFLEYFDNIDYGDPFHIVLPPEDVNSKSALALLGKLKGRIYYAQESNKTTNTLSALEGLASIGER